MAQMTQDDRRSFRIGAALGTALLVFSLAACAPEPTDLPDGGTDGGGKGGEPTTSETDWGGQEVPEEELVTELPSSFPSEAFQLPGHAVLYNAGERAEGVWFAVLQADDAATADALWSELVSLNGFEASDEVETTEGGRAATLTSPALNVQALTIPQTDGTVLLSYDLTAAG